MYPKVFADSLPLQEKRDEPFIYCLLGIPFDGTSSFWKGSRLGPRALRESSYNFESFIPDLGLDLQDLPVFDAGDLDEAHTMDDLRVIMDMELRNLFMNHPVQDLFPVFMGGEHSLTPLALNHIVPAFQEIGMKVGVLYLDAHMDMRDEYHETPYSHACAARRVSEIVDPGNIIPMGVRSWSVEEDEFIRETLTDEGFTFYENHDVFDMDASEAPERAVEQLVSNGCDKIYLSIDMDVLDPSIAPGVGNPEPDGLTYSDVLDIIDPAAPYLCGIDLVETNPLHDNGITAIHGAKLIREIMALHHSRKSQ